ncbi:MAG: hypothetical protein ACFCU1_00340 [Sumerlaeia bacterium]
MFRFPEDPSQAWCGSCYEKNPQCLFCNKPTSAEVLLQLDANNVSCKECRTTAVQGLQEYEELIDVIHPQVEQILGRTFKRIPVRLVTPSEMNVLMSTLQGSMPDPNIPEKSPANAGKGGSFLDPIEPQATKRVGQFAHGLGLFIQRGNTREIVLLNNLPADMAWETISHELTHAWQNEHYPGNMDFYLVEGFAQVIARKICMRNYRSTRLNSIAEREDSYGHAYRVVHLLETEQGLPGILKALEERKLPPEFRTNSSQPYKEKDFVGTITIN